MRRHLEDIINVIRALVMDPNGDIQKESCYTLELACKAYKNILLNYTQTMCKALLLPLVSKKSKIRIAAMQALNAALQCGLWKFNAFVFEDLIGFRDPNSVPIRDFYNVKVPINSAFNQHQLPGYSYHRPKRSSSIGLYEVSARMDLCALGQVRSPWQTCALCSIRSL